MQKYIHIPVMKREVGEILDLARGGYFVDCTLGLGGHSEMILEGNPDNRVLGIDKDGEALAMAEERLYSFGARFKSFKADFKDIDSWSRALEREPDGILVDLGISSLQLREGRGFSFKDTASLDMRMDTTTGRTAADLIADASAEELLRIFKDYGEVEKAYYAARAISERRRVKRIATARDLAEIITSSIHQKKGRERIDPATKVFQALRIAVNGELEGLADFFRKAASLLAASGKIVVIAYHSLEDRIVKTVFRELERGCICPPRLPVCGCGRKKVVELPSKGALKPKMDEVLDNPSSRSARLRYAVKI